MSTQPSYSDWIWSPEHRRYYCYRYTDDGHAEYMWSDAAAEAQEQTRSTSSLSRQGRDRGARTTTSTSEHYHHQYTYDDGTTAYKPSSSPPPPPPPPLGSTTATMQQSRHNTAPREGHDQQQQQQQQHPPHRLKRGSADDVRRFHDGDEVSMAIEDRGQVVRASFAVRRGRLNNSDANANGGRWEYQLWHENGTVYDGGHWFRETELS